MPLIQGATAPTFTLPHAIFTGLAAPSRGSAETSVWRVKLAPQAIGAPHSLTREEIFVAIAGRAVAEIDGERIEVAEGDALVVPAGRMLSLGNPHAEPFEAVCVFPVGGQARQGDADPFIPPWAQ